MPVLLDTDKIVEAGTAHKETNLELLVTTLPATAASPGISTDPPTPAFTHSLITALESHIAPATAAMHMVKRKLSCLHARQSQLVFPKGSEQSHKNGVPATSITPDTPGPTAAETCGVAPVANPCSSSAPA
jgi:hypothetical protein